MHTVYTKNYQATMKHSLSSGVTPALFELDVQRGNDILLQAQISAAARTNEIESIQKWSVKLQEISTSGQQKFRRFLALWKVKSI